MSCARPHIKHLQPPYKLILTKLLNSSLAFLERVTESITIVGLMVSILLTALQVISRYVFLNPFTWTEELVRYLFVLVTFFGAGLALRRYELVSLEFVLKRIPSRCRKIFEIVTIVLPICFILLFIKYGLFLVGVAKQGKTVTPALQAPMYVIYSIYTASGFFMLAFAIGCLIEVYKRKDYVDSPKEGSGPHIYR